VLVLIELGGSDVESPRLLGRVYDEDLVRSALGRLEQGRLRELAALPGRSTLRVVGDSSSESDDGE
jgi:hypothetical protein